MLFNVVSNILLNIFCLAIIVVINKSSTFFYLSLYVCTCANVVFHVILVCLNLKKLTSMSYFAYQELRGLINLLFVLLKFVCTRVNVI